MKKKIVYLLLPVFAVSLLVGCSKGEPVPVGEEHTVTFVSTLEGAPVPPPQKVIDGYTATKPSDPSFKGYDFIDWYLDDVTFQDKYDFNTNVRSDLTLYAKWDITQCTITFDSKGGTPIAPITTDFGNVIKEPDEPTYGARIFSGWYNTKDDKKFDFSQEIQSSVTLYARWDDIESTTFISFKNGTAGKKVAFNYEGELTLVDWGDGSKNTQSSHTYSAGRSGDIYIKGRITSISFADSTTGEPLADNGQLPILRLNLGEGLRSIPDYAFSGMTFALRDEYGRNIQVLEIPETMESIGSHAFANSKGLRAIQIPATVETTGDNVFSGSEFVDIYCKAEAKPEKWDKNWANGSSAIHPCWGVLARLEDQGFAYVVLTDKTACIEKYIGEGVETLEIPETLSGLDGQPPVTVTTIGPLINANIGKIVIPNTVKTIWDSAFKGLQNIYDINIPRSVETIGDNAFASIKPKSIAIPNTVINMGSKVFENSSVSMIFCEPNAKPGTWKNDWSDNTSNHAAIYWGYKEPGDAEGFAYAIVGSGDNREAYITDYTGQGGAIIIPETVGDDNVPVTRICKDSFRGDGLYESSITSVQMPDSITTIDDHAFWGCIALSSIKLSNNLQSIGEYAFYRNAFNEITIPRSVTTIGQQNFFGHSLSVKQVYCEAPKKPDGWAEDWLSGTPNNLYWGYISKGTTDDGYSYVETQKGTYITGHTAGESLELDIPASVGEGETKTVIGISNSAFAGRNDIISLQFPDSITSIGNDAFSNCRNLSGEIRFPSSIKTIGNIAFINPGNGAEFYLSDNLITVGENAFGKNGFSSKFEHIDIYCSMQETPGTWSDNWCCIAPNYERCVTVHMDYISRGTDENSRLTYIEHTNCIEIDGCIDGLKAVIIPEEINGKPVEIIGDSAFYDGNYDGKEIETLYIPDSVKKIGTYAFAYCQELRRIYIPDSVEEIGNRAFMRGPISGTIGRYEMIYCEASAKPDKWNEYWNEFGPNSDEHSADFSLVTWGVSRSVDEASGFEYMDVTAETGNPNAHITRYLGSSETVSIPETINGLTVNYIDAAFYNNPSVESVTLPNTITTISANAFASCPKLQVIRLISYNDPEILPSAHLNAFVDSSDVKFVVSSEEVRDALIALGEMVGNREGWPTDTERYIVEAPQP